MFEKQKNNDHAYLPEEISKNCKYEIANCQLCSFDVNVAPFFRRLPLASINAFSLLIIIII